MRALSWCERIRHPSSLNFPALALLCRLVSRVVISARFCIAVELNLLLLYNPSVLSDSKMRRKVIFFVVVGLLFCSLATLETTEFLKLADDTSNDFSLLNVETNTSSVIVRQSQEAQAKAVPVRAPIRSRQPKLLPTIFDASNASNDHLHVLCVMRT
jgi:hypothetical protein